jgi:hypothetical protein
MKAGWGLVEIRIAVQFRRFRQADEKYSAAKHPCCNMIIVLFDYIKQHLKAFSFSLSSVIP